MSAYRVEFADLLTDRPILAGGVSGLRFGRRIGQAEEISGTVTVTRDNAPQIRALLAGRTAVYVYDGRSLLAGGVLWDPQPSWSKRAAETWQFAASTFESYWDQVVITEDIPAATGMDQLEIARTLVRHMQSDARANLGVQLDLAVSGVLRDRTQYLASANKSYGESIAQLGEVEGGFEWTIDVYTEPTSGRRVKYMRFGYPQLGSASQVHVIEDAIEAWSETTAAIATRYRSRGGTPQGSGLVEQQPCLSTVHEATELLDAGWPRIDQVTDYSTVTNPATLESHAARDLQRGISTRAIPQVTINLEATDLTPAAIGHTVRIRRYSLLRGLTDEQYRLIGMVVTAEDRETAPTAVLTLEAV